MPETEAAASAGLPFLKAENVLEAIKRVGKAEFLITTPHKMVKDNFATDEDKAKGDDTKPSIDGKLIMSKNGKEIEEHQWTPNGTSWNDIREKLGTNSDTWPGKKVDLTVVESTIAGKLRDVIYTTGAKEKMRAK